MTTAIELVRSFRQLRALVIGDVMLDTYLEGTAARLCSEGPVPVIRKTAEYRIPGGAANTAANIRALGAVVMLLSIVGADSAGVSLRTALRERGISDRWLIEDSAMPTLHKLRILADGQYVARFDEGDLWQPSRESSFQQELLDRLEKAYARCDLVIISDYRYGTLSDALIERLCQLHTANPKVLLVDSKELQRFRAVPATAITPNYLEACLLTSQTVPPHPTPLDLEAVARLGQSLLSTHATEHVVITLAEHGVFLMDRRSKAMHVPAHPVAQAHDVGAGDSFASTLGLALAAQGSMLEAVQIAIDAASIAITKRRTAVVQHQELLQRVSLRTFATSSQTHTEMEGLQHVLLRLALQLENERRTGRKIVFTNGVFDILHAGHVHFLRQAKALGDVLIVGINSDSSARRLKGQGRPINSERDRVALVAALDAVDHVLLFDEETPTQLIRTLKPDIHVKGGDYTTGDLPEAEAVHEGGGQVVILPLVGSISTTGVIERIAAFATQSGSARKAAQS